MDTLKKLTNFVKTRSWVDLVVVCLLTIPAFAVLLNNQYFSMHDDQHIARLFLFDKALKESWTYPRWVDGLGFGYGYPLFNYYPPLIYFIAEAFHLVGFSLIWSVKLVVIIGYLLAAVGTYLFVRRIFDRPAGVLASVLYTYAVYHAVVVYVRGALAEFFAMTILPFLFLAIDTLSRRMNVSSALVWGITFALLMINHPLIAFPSVFFISFFYLHYLLIAKGKDQRVAFTKLFALGGVTGAALSAFFWVPSFLEKQYTYVDKILTNELASYTIHFLYPSQLWFSPWGFGGSIDGPNDGMPFKLGKLHIMAAAVSAIGAILYLILKRNTLRKTLIQLPVRHMIFTGLVLGFSLLMTLHYSKPIWDMIQFLWYLQFPWRFLTFVAFFLSVFGASWLYLTKNALHSRKHLPGWLTGSSDLIIGGLVMIASLAVIIVSAKNHAPQKLLSVTDEQLTTREEISWRISRTSFEFVPQGVVTKKSEYGTTILDIDPEDIKKEEYDIVDGAAVIQPIRVQAAKKDFAVLAGKPTVFRLNTFMFPGWVASLKGVDGEVTELPIRDDNPYRLITVDLPPGEYELTFTFTETPVRTIANLTSIVALLGTIGYFIVQRRSKKNA
jgi:hypothetical protein